VAAVVLLVVAGAIGPLDSSSARRPAAPPVPAKAFVLRTPDGVAAFAYSPDGRVLVTAGRLGLRRWDAATGDELGVLADGRPADPDEATAVAFAPDGRTIVSGHRSGTLRRWDAATGAALDTLAGLAEPVTSLVFAPDGRTLAGAGRGGAVQLWNAATGAALRTLTGGGNARFRSSLTFFPDGHRIARAAETLTVWDATTGKVIEQPSLGPSGLSANTMAVSPSGATSAVGGWRWLRLVGPAPGEQRELTGHEGEVASIAFAPDGRTLASAGEFYDHSVRVWDVQTGRQIRALCERCGPFHQVAFAPGGRAVAAADDKQLQVWPA
jgi:WD40 repeat protein